jgi:endoglycosylceramidase
VTRATRSSSTVLSVALCAVRALALAGALAVPGPLVRWGPGPTGCHSESGTPAARTCTIAPPSPPDWRLRADGTALRDGLGRVVFLRGVNAGGRSKFAPFVPFDYASGQYASALASYMDRAASWGIDAVRVPFTWAALEPVQGQHDEEWLGRYEQLLQAAWARGIWTVVDFHQDVYSEAFCGDGFPLWTIPDPKPAPHHDCTSWQLEYFQDADVKAAFDRFWAAGSPVMAAFLGAWDFMIARFKDTPGVAGFEPINEPGWGSAATDKFEATTLSAFYAQMVPRVRAAAPLALVFVEPTGFAGSIVTTTLQRPPGDGVVFAPHYYPISSPNPETVLPKMQGWANVGAQWNVPTFVGEFGSDHDSDTTADYMAGHFAALDSLGLSGTEWEYSVESEQWNQEGDSVVASDGTEYPVAQVLVRPFARAIAGGALTQTWDGASRTFSLAYATGSAATNVSEVQLPARAYPTGINVALSGGCYDATSAPGRLLVQADDGAPQVSLTVTPR